MKVKLSIALLFICMILLLGGCSFSTAKVTNAIPCKNVDDQGKPIDPQDVFSTQDKVIYVSAKTNNVPSDTNIKMVWYYTGKDGREQIAEVSLKLDKSRYVKAYLKSDAGFPEGRYEVEFYVDQRTKPDQTAKVTVK